MPVLGRMAEDANAVHEQLMRLHPWRKGPLQLAGVKIDTEWRSDWKWQRIEPHIGLDGHTVLDIGCGNGYFGLRMLAHGARRVIERWPGMERLVLHVKGLEQSAYDSRAGSSCSACTGSAVRNRAKAKFMSPA